MHQSSRLVHRLESNLPPVRTVNPPLYRGSTVLFANFAELLKANRGEYPGPTYGTDRLPQQRILEETLRELEGAALTRVFPSGISAISETLLALVKAGDHILVTDNAYSPTFRFCHEILAKFGVHTQRIPPDVGSNISNYLQAKTRLVLLESPGSLTFELQDIPAITDITRSRGVVAILDNTWATPLFLDPFKLGVDISIHSVTKYISGHSDLLMGSVSTNEALAEMLASAYACREIYVSPEDCLIALKGLKTLSLRMREHQSSALAVAHALSEHPLVEAVLHPALPSHPQHAVWKRDYRGSSGLFAFTLKEEYTDDALAQCIDSLQFFGIGYSWGGFMSLVTAGRPLRAFPGPLSGKTIIRLNIGLEDPEELIADLRQGLGRLADSRQHVMEVKE